MDATPVEARLVPALRDLPDERQLEAQTVVGDECERRSGGCDQRHEDAQHVAMPAQTLGPQAAPAR